MARELEALHCGYDQFICLECPLNHGLDGEPWRNYPKLSAGRNALAAGEVNVEELEVQSFSDNDIGEMQGCIELSRTPE